jgi:hypothetical protein
VRQRRHGMNRTCCHAAVSTRSTSKLLPDAESFHRDLAGPGGAMERGPVLFAGQTDERDVPEPVELLCKPAPNRCWPWLEGI